MIESWQMLDLLTALVDKSLVVYETDASGEGRYRLLETVRQYAQGKQSENHEEQSSLVTNHRAFYVSLFEETEAELNGPDQARTLARLEAEHDNLRLAALPTGSDTDTLREQEARLRLGTAAFAFCNTKGYFSELRTWLSAALESSETVDTRIRARALNSAGSTTWRQGDYSAARAYLEEARSLWLTLNDPEGLASAVNNLANATYYQGDHARAEVLYKEFLALARQNGKPQAIAAALNNVGLVAQDKGDQERAEACFAEGLEIRRTLGDRKGIANLLGNLSQTLLLKGDTEGARALIAESKAIRTELGDRLGLAYTLQYEGRIAVLDRDLKAARNAYSESLRLRSEVGEKWGVAVGLERLGDLALQEEQWVHAVTLFGASEALCQAIGASPTPEMEQARDGRIAQLRAALADDTYENAWLTGYSLSPEDAVTFALSPPSQKT